MCRPNCHYIRQLRQCRSRDVGHSMSKYNAVIECVVFTANAILHGFTSHPQRVRLDSRSAQGLRRTLHGEFDAGNHVTANTAPTTFRGLLDDLPTLIRHDALMPCQYVDFSAEKYTVIASSFSTAVSRSCCIAAAGAVVLVK